MKPNRFGNQGSEAGDGASGSIKMVFWKRGEKKKFMNFGDNPLDFVPVSVRLPHKNFRSIGHHLGVPQGPRNFQNANLRTKNENFFWHKRPSIPIEKFA